MSGLCVIKYPVYFLVATTSGFIQVACSQVQPRKVTIEKKDEINEYKKKERIDWLIDCLRSSKQYFSHIQDEKSL
jgi:hypothetical protein